MEVRQPGDVEVRDSKDPAGPELSFDARRWQEFVDGVKNGFGR